MQAKALKPLRAYINQLGKCPEWKYFWAFSGISNTFVPLSHAKFVVLHTETDRAIDHNKHCPDYAENAT